MYYLFLTLICMFALDTICEYTIFDNFIPLRNDNPMKKKPVDQILAYAFIRACILMIAPAVYLWSLDVESVFFFLLLMLNMARYMAMDYLMPDKPNEIYRIDPYSKTWKERSYNIFVIVFTWISVGFCAGVF